MEFPFPPPPPDAATIATARWVLVAWSLIGLVILIFRVRRFGSIHRLEMGYWLLAAGVCGIIAAFGHSRYQVWDDNVRLMWAIFPAIGVCVGGIATGLLKLFTEGFWSDFNLSLATCILFVVFFLGIPFFQPAVISGPPSLRLECLNNQRQLGLAMTNKSQTSGAFLPSSRGESLTSWRVLLLPQLDADSIYSKYDQLRTWESPPNDELARVRRPDMTCPSNYYREDAQRRRFTAFSMPTGAHTIGENPEGTPLAAITDGLSHTLLFVEASGAQIVWTEPRDVNVDTQPTGINLPGNKPCHSGGWLSSYHRGSVNVVLADGAAKTLSTSIDPALLKKLSTIDGGEKIRENEFP